MTSLGGFVSANGRVNTIPDGEVRYYVAANMFSATKVNGPTSISLYQFWAYLGANKRVTVLPDDVVMVESDGSYSTAPDMQTIIPGYKCVAMIDTRKKEVGYRITFNGEVVHESGPLGDGIETSPLIGVYGMIKFKPYTPSAPTV